MVRSVLQILLLILLTYPVSAHEFWIEPQAMTLEPEEPLRPVVMIGTGFRGESHPFQPKAYRRIIWTAPQAGRAPEGADDTLTRFSQIAPGLHILGVESNAQVISHPTAEDFAAFIAEVGLSDRIDTTDAALVPGGPVIERYRRFSKTLVHFQKRSGADDAIGLQYEWVRQGDGLLLLEKGAPKADHPAFVFCRTADGIPIDTRSYRTDRRGRIFPDLEPQQTCLVNATFVERRKDRSWLSSWASLLFAP